VVEAHSLDSEQAGRHAREAPGQDQRPHCLFPLPQVRDLQERLPIGVALLQRPRLPAVAQGGLHEDLPPGCGRVGRAEAANGRVSLILEGLDGLVVNLDGLAQELRWCAHAPMLNASA